MTNPPHTPPHTPEDVLARLDALAIPYTLHRHPALRTGADAKAFRGTMAGGHCKNLFLRDRKGKMWLVSTLEDTVVDLKALGELLGGRLSFGSADRLMTYLGIIPGAVSPLAVINDTEQTVTVILDAAMMAVEQLNFHPLSNEMTVTIAATDLQRFIVDCGHQPETLSIAGDAA